MGQMQTGCLLEELTGLCNGSKHTQLHYQDAAELFPQHKAITYVILQECLVHTEDMKYSHSCFLYTAQLRWLQLELQQDLIFCQCRWFFTLLQIGPQTRLSFLSLRSFYSGNSHSCYCNQAWNPIGNRVSLASQQSCRFPRVTVSVR